MPGELCIYVSGLPGAGKTTAGRYLSELLSLPMLDKDDYLEALFESCGYGDASRRQELSREADLQFQRDALLRDRVLLVSHWRPQGVVSDSGTPGDWLVDGFDEVVEVCCHCPVQIACERFIERERHPGHTDGSRSRADIEARFADYAQRLPIGYGRRISLDTRGSAWKRQAERLLAGYR